MRRVIVKKSGAVGDFLTAPGFVWAYSSLVATMAVMP